MVTRKKTFAILASLLGLCSALALDAAEKPNILFILADDIGYGDLGCYGATKVKTPTLDRLASQGCRFTDAHTTASTCTPTRYALLTGQYAWRHQPGSRILPGDAPLGIRTERVTLPKLLKRAGYTTGIVGKWHLGLGDLPKTDYNRDLKPGPLEVGFDSAFIIPATGDRVPCVYVENHRVLGLDPADPITLDYSIKRGEPKSYVRGVPRIGGMTGGKAALWNDAEMADTLARRAIQFIEKNRGGPFFLYFATHGIHVPRVPHPRFKGTSQSGVRGDQIHELDDTVSQVLAALDRFKLTENTLVIFTSDNGGVLDTNGPDEVNSGNKETANGHLQNGPLRGTKGTVLEGGHRVPFIARWPGRIKAGATNDLLFGLVDMAATFAALTGVPLPADAAPDSFNALPALLNAPGAKPVRDHLVFHNGGTNGPFGVRLGQWKLLAASGQLYHLANDLGETNNLAAREPAKLQELRALLAKVRAADRSRP
jgi:arylsulfatase A-like enzyme